MATVKIKVGDNYEYEITDQTKDTTYVFANEDAALGSVLNFKPVDYDGNLIYAKNGNDLLIYAKFGEEPNHKTSITTIKDYFAYCEGNNGLVCINDDSIYATTAYAYDFVSKNFEDTNLGGYFLGAKGSNKYTFSNTDTVRTTVVEAGGSDKYTFDELAPTTSTVRIEDMGGNDSYTITSSKGIVIDDFFGNDKYTIKNCIELEPGGSEENPHDIYISDYSGNDTYNFDNFKTVEGQDTRLFLYDEKGNDKYTLNENYHVEIDDYSGNDTYTVKNTHRLYIYDYEEDYYNVKGNDKFNITDSSDIEIDCEYGNGKKNFNFKQCSDIDIYCEETNSNKYNLTDCDNVTIEEDDSFDYEEDKNSGSIYNLKNITTYLNIRSYKDYSNDKYTISGANLDLNSSNVITSEINDNDGKDTYKITKTNNLEMLDYSNENDTYTITNCDNFHIHNSSGDEKYTLKNTSNVRLRDNLGEDTYNITSCSGMYIHDENNSSDTYTIKLAKEGGGITIRDEGGDADSLKISNLNQKNIVFMSNFNNSGVDADNSLIMYDTKSGGFVQICDLYQLSGSDYSTEAFGNGFIETVKAGKTIDISSLDIISQLNSAREAVAGFLTDGMSVVDVLNSGDAAQIGQLITYFNPNG